VFSVLIVDDNIYDREGLRDIINWNELGLYVADIASDGMEGYKKAKEIHPDFIITDIAMPVMDGLQMAEKIKQEFPDIKFIFMSCFDDFNYVRHALKLNAYAYVLKPVNPDELIQEVIKIKKIKENELEKDKLFEELRQQIKQSSSILKEQFLREILISKQHQDDKLQEAAEYFGIDCQKHCYTVIFAEIDNYNIIVETRSVEDKYLLSYGIKKYLEQSLFSVKKTYIIHHQLNSIAMVCFVKNEKQDEELGDIISCLQECMELINKNLEITVTIGIGEFSNTLSYLPRIYESAEYAVRTKFYSHGNRIILSSEVKPANSPAKYDVKELYEELNTILEIGEEENTNSFIEKYLPSHSSYSEQYVKSLTFSIINAIQIFLIDKNESFVNIFGSDTVIWQKLSRFETIIDIKQWIFNIIETVRKYFRSQSKNRYVKIVEDIKNIIDKKYAEVNNVDEIVAPLYISSSYANLIFKQHTGQTIFDYLVSRRMEEAKKLLQDPYVKIYEVAEKVGYKSKSYFTSIFKEYFGMTPKQFMDRLP